MFYKTTDHHGLKSNPFKACITPRPIAWISSQDINGNLNIAPFSYFNAVADDPPMIMFSGTNTHIDGGFKDSMVNIEQTGEFVVNIVAFEDKEKMNLSSMHLPRKHSEFDYADITTTKSFMVKPPRVKSSPIALECIYHDSILLPKGQNNLQTKMILGRVIGIYIDDKIISDGLINIAKYKPLARLGYDQYAVIEKSFSIPKPK